ncbi:MAG: hypothetical protein KJN71_06060 [Acidimicrobiia bacterium]|nr:hypothetical protein [Acidimicrobiia bacterium]
MIEERVRTVLDGLEVAYETMPCDPDLADTAAFCEHYGVALADSANAILLASKRPAGVHAMFIVLATTRLDVNGMSRQLMGVKKVSFADADTTMAITGMEVGGVTPFGAPGEIPVFVDSAVMDRDRVVVGGGSRSMKVTVDPSAFVELGATVVEGLAA